MRSSGDYRPQNKYTLKCASRFTFVDLISYSFFMAKVLYSLTMAHFLVFLNLSRSSAAKPLSLLAWIHSKFPIARPRYRPHDYSTDCG